MIVRVRASRPTTEHSLRRALTRPVSARRTAPPRTGSLFTILRPIVVRRYASAPSSGSSAAARVRGKGHSVSTRRSRLRSISRRCRCTARLAAVFELVGARVLQKPADDRAHLDPLADAGDPGPQAAGAADDQTDFDAGLRGPIEEAHDRGSVIALFFMIIRRRPAGAACSISRSMSAGAAAQADRRDQQPLVVLLAASIRSGS